ncbi:MAG: HsdR family type I site-specific deoxyribonuclease [Bacteroidota bacterium]
MPSSTVGQREIKVQQRVIALLRDRFGQDAYQYLGNWKGRHDARNIEGHLLREWLAGRGVDEGLIERVLYKLEQAAALGENRTLYEANRAVYELLRYGVQVKPSAGQHNVTIPLIDWDEPRANHFALAEEVTIRAGVTKRPDLVFYVNGIALAVLELKRSTVSVAEGIRQNLLNQEEEIIRPFFTTMQLVLAGNDTEGLRYGTIDTPERFYLEWREENPAYPQDPAASSYLPNGTWADAAGGPVSGLLDCALLRLMEPARLLELIHDFIVFDAGVKKVGRHNQYFGVKAAQRRLARREGGIIWHTQGSGKSLTMVWLAKWLLSTYPAARVLIVTDRTELDEQIETVFHGVSETIVRTTSGADLLDQLGTSTARLLCTLVHKFGHAGTGEAQGGRVQDFIKDLERSLPAGFQVQGDLYVFVDECHRTQSGDLHEAMRALLPSALFVGFTGTPLLASDKKRSIEVFGAYIHTYKFDQAVQDGVVLDLRYEARSVEQRLTSEDKVDQWFANKTRGLTDVARGQLKQKWGTMQRVLSSRSRLEKIVQDIVFDMETKPRLMSGHGNAMLVASSIYQACKYFELFRHTTLKGHCAVITSYEPTLTSIRGETTGEGETEKRHQYEIYRTMLAEYFDLPKDEATARVEAFEKTVKEQFIKAPAQMKLLIVVDKLLTGFDAPPATYLYIDKRMKDHGLFQAICRVNRLDGQSEGQVEEVAKRYGYIVDYMDLFQSLEQSITDYTSGAFEDYDQDDVQGLLQNRLETGRADLETAREQVKALCEPVARPRATQDYLHYFCAEDTADAEALAANAARRATLYKAVGRYARAYAELASDLEAAGLSPDEAARIQDEVKHYEQVRQEVRLASGDYVDMKRYEPAMRYLLDAYIQADESTTVSQLDNLGLVDVLVQHGPEALREQLPQGLREQDAMAETIENNVRKKIVDKQEVNPKYYARMSELLTALIAQRRAQALSYAEYLKDVRALAAQVADPAQGSHYPSGIDTPAKQALYDNLERDEALALQIDQAVREARLDSWRGNAVKEVGIKRAIYDVTQDIDVTEAVFLIVKNQADY